MPIVEQKATTKQISKVVVKRMVDSDPDTSYLGEYSNQRASEYSIDREHSLDCPVNTGLASELLSDEDSAECDCGEHGDRLRNEYQYFNPSFNYVDKAGNPTGGLTPENVRKYTQQDYERMESLHKMNWCYLGIIAEAQVHLTTSDLFQTVTSGGILGIESDSDESFLRETEQEELGGLREELHAMGFSKRAISAAFKKIEHEDE